jgi:hypothetical protein
LGKQEADCCTTLGILQLRAKNVYTKNLFVFQTQHTVADVESSLDLTYGYKHLLSMLGEARACTPVRASPKVDFARENDGLLEKLRILKLIFV